MTQALRGAWARFTGRLYFTQWVGNAVLMLLAASWLQIPDSHTWQFAFSMVSGVLLVVAFCWLYTMTFRQLLACVPRPPHWRSWLVLALLVGLWWMLLQPVAAGRAHEGVFAGYWNSQSPPWLRHRLGYSQWVGWQERIYDWIEWLWAGFLLPLAVELCACGLRPGWFRRACRVYRHWLYWLCVLLFAWVASAVTWGLAGWTPVYGLAGQIFSIGVRLGIAYSVDIALTCFLLALVAWCLDRPVEETVLP